MQLVFHQSGNASKDLALDEALLESAPWRRQQSHASHGEVLRLWHFVQPTLILGRASRFREEVNLEYCQRNGIPILRRCTGGASVVAGPGCLIYSLILNQQHRPEMEDITHVHRFVAQNLHSAMQSCFPDEDSQGELAIDGICDLTFRDRKYSGNSMRKTRDDVLYHGTILLDADLDLIASCLAFAPRQPEYRRGRDHRAFITNVPARREIVLERIAGQFCGQAVSVDHVEDLIQPGVWERLMLQRYENQQWHRRR